MSDDNKDDLPGIGVAILFGFVAVALPLLPAYFGWRADWFQVTCFVLAGISLAIGVVGVAVELRQLGFFDGPSWENVGYALGFAVLAVVFHFVTTVVPVTWLDVVLKIIVAALGVVALGFLAFALGQLLVDQRRKRDSGTVTSSSRTKAVGATVIFLLTLLTALVGLITRILEFMAVER